MAKITPSDLIKTMSGRTCSLSKEYFSTNTQTGKVYATKRCKEYVDDPTTLQQQVRSTFTTNSVIVKNWAATNRPTSTNKKGTAEFQAMKKQFVAQHQYGNWFAFVRSKITDGAVPSFITGTSSSSGTPTVTPEEL